MDGKTSILAVSNQNKNCKILLAVSNQNKNCVIVSGSINCHFFILKEENMNFKYYHIYEKYLNYLRTFEFRIPKTEYSRNIINSGGNSKKIKLYKPFIGIVFNHNNVKYCTQISSPKEKHYHIKETLDFKKILF